MGRFAVMSCLVMHLGVCFAAVPLWVWRHDHYAYGVRWFVLTYLWVLLLLVLDYWVWLMLVFSFWFWIYGCVYV